MKGTRARVALAVCGVLLQACAPQLNWREVPLGRLTTLLPCKPDNASRTVVLGADTVTMEMAGCEAGGALFAISRVQGPDAEAAQRLISSLRKDSLANVGAQAIRPAANSGDASTSFDVQVDGRHPDGKPLQARFKWLLAGTEVYQIAAYADRLEAQQTDNLLRELRIR